MTRSANWAGPDARTVAGRRATLGPGPSGRALPPVAGRPGLRRTGAIHGQMDWNRRLRITPERPYSTSTTAATIASSRNPSIEAPLLRPIPTAVPPKRKNGTSLPNCAAILLNSGNGNVRRASGGSANNTAAASLEPPPRPAPIGIRLVRRISTRPVIRMDSIARRAARTTRLSAI